jgi:murein DD-endopeptidase MepM/ murein hydrolase activator NlpD
VSLRKKIAENLGRKVTVVIVPHTELSPWRLQFSTGFLAFCALVWSGLTVWAGYIAGRHVDYYITKADNQVLTAKMAYVAGEMDKSQQVLESVRATDKQLRQLLALADKGSQTVQASVVPAQDLGKLLSGRAADIRPGAFRSRMLAIRDEANRRLASFQEISWYLSNQRNLYEATPSIWPTAGQVTSNFGYRLDPMSHEGDYGQYHQGIDIANKADTLIYATADGTVREAGWSHGYGQRVVIDHGYGVSTHFGHTSKLLVKTGEHVKRGQVIAYMGTTGRSTGAHLHYEVWKQGKPVNPMAFLKSRGAEELLLTQADPVKTTGR